MCPDSLARNALAGWIRSSRLQHRRRDAGELVDLQGQDLAQLVRDRRVALRVAEADGRGDVERACGATCRAPSVPVEAGGAMNSRRRRLTLTGSRTCGPCPEPSSSTSSPPVSSARAIPRLRPEILSSVALDHEHRQRRRRQRSRAASSSSISDLRCDQCLGRRLEPPADAVLDGLGRVRLREHLREEELEEAAVVSKPVVAVVLAQPLLGVELLVPGEELTIRDRLAERKRRSR